MRQNKEPVQDDSDLDCKRWESEALLQRIGVWLEPSLVQIAVSVSLKSWNTPSEAGSQDSGELGPSTRSYFKTYVCVLRFKMVEIEGCVLISSCESIKIAISCEKTVDRRTLEPTKKR